MRPRYSDIQISLRPGDDVKPQWKEQARAALRQLAGTGAPFTADDLYEMVDHPDQLHSPNARNNAIGQIFREGHAAGLIEAIGIEQSKQPHRKGGMVRVWQGKHKHRLVRVGGSNGNQEEGTLRRQAGQAVR